MSLTAATRVTSANGRWTELPAAAESPAETVPTPSPNLHFHQNVQFGQNVDFGENVDFCENPWIPTKINIFMVSHGSYCEFARFLCSHVDMTHVLARFARAARALRARNGAPMDPQAPRPVGLDP